MLAPLGLPTGNGGESYAVPVFTVRSDVDIVRLGSFFVMWAQQTAQRHLCETTLLLVAAGLATMSVDLSNEFIKIAIVKVRHLCLFRTSSNR